MVFRDARESLKALVGLSRGVLRGRAKLVAENALLRQQVSGAHVGPRLRVGITTPASCSPIGPGLTDLTFPAHAAHDHTSYRTGPGDRRRRCLVLGWIFCRAQTRTGKNFVDSECFQAGRERAARGKGVAERSQHAVQPGPDDDLAGLDITCQSALSQCACRFLHPCAAEKRYHGRG